jgi:hypothetical protein
MDGVDGALGDMDSPDRNVRVAALRALAREAGPRAAAGLLRGLNDPKRRVRMVATKCASAHLDGAAITDRLSEIVRDESEIRRIRASALHCLAAAGRPIPDAAAAAIQDLVQADSHRTEVLFLLARSPLTPATERLLEEIVRIGTKDEAVTATRALCGFRVAHIGEFRDPNDRRRIERTCARAAGRVFYWVPRDAEPELAAWLRTERDTER